MNLHPQDLLLFHELTLMNVHPQDLLLSHEPTLCFWLGFINRTIFLDHKVPLSLWKVTMVQFDLNGAV